MTEQGDSSTFGDALDYIHHVSKAVWYGFWGSIVGSIFSMILFAVLLGIIGLLTQSEMFLDLGSLNLMGVQLRSLDWTAGARLGAAFGMITGGMAGTLLYICPPGR